MSTIVKTVNINPGESFTLPPGASIVGITGTLSSSCGTLPTPQTAACFGLNFSIVDGSIGGQHPSMSELMLTGFKLNGNIYPFKNGKLHNNGSIGIPLDTYCAEVPSLNGLFTFICNPTRYISNGDVSSYASTFKMLPSFGNDAYLIGYYLGEAGADRVDILFKVKGIADIANACTCS